jgi:hypothetical protein
MSEIADDVRTFLDFYGKSVEFWDLETVRESSTKKRDIPQGSH